MRNFTFKNLKTGETSTLPFADFIKQNRLCYTRAKLLLEGKKVNNWIFNKRTIQ